MSHVDPYLRIALATLVAVIFFACQTDAPTVQSEKFKLGDNCQTIPDLLVPEGLPDTVRRELKWVNSIYAFTEGNPYLAMSRDTIARLEKIIGLLEVDGYGDDLHVQLARTKRLLAFNMQNEDRYKSSFELLKVSAEELERHGDSSTIAAYELGYHYNLIAYCALEASQAELALANSYKSLKINADKGLLTEVIKEYLNIAVAYGNIERYEMQEELMEEAFQLAQRNAHCFETANEVGIIANFYYTKALYGFIKARRELYKGDTARALVGLRASVANFGEAKQKIRAVKLDTTLFIQFRLAVLQSSMGLNFPFIPGLKDSATVAATDMLGVLPPGHPYYYLFQVRNLWLQSFDPGGCAAIESDEYKNLVAFVKATPFESVPISLQLTYLNIEGILASMEATCGVENQDDEMASVAKDRALAWITDFEYMVGKADLELDLENIGGNWRGQYAVATDIVAKTEAYLNKEDRPLPFSNSLLSLSDRSKSMSFRLALEKRKAYESYGDIYKSLYERLTGLRQDLRESQRGSRVGLAKQDSLAAFFTALKESDLPHKVQFYNDLRYFDDVDVADVRQKLLTDNRAALDYFYGRSELIVSIITKTEVKQWKLPVSQKFADAITSLRDLDAAGNRSAEHTFLLYRLALQPIIKWLSDHPRINELIIARDKQLVDFAFEYFPMEPVSGSGWSAGKLVGDRYAITYAYSLSTLLAAKDIQLARAPAPKLHGAFLATKGFSVTNREVPSLPKFGGAVADISRYFGDRSALEIKATPDDFYRSAVDYRFLTVAAHGYENEVEAEQFYLQLHPNRENDGRVTASRLYSLLLPTDLTILLNCESARGSKHNFEGRKSLARSFLYAGSSAVIAGNSQLSDETYPEITTEFFRLWMEDGLPAHLALHQAKMTFRKQHPGLPPTLWGELIYYGLPDIYFKRAPKVTEEKVGLSLGD